MLVHITSHKLNWTELQFANFTVNIRVGIGLHVLRTNRTLTVLVPLQPINTKYPTVTLTRVTNEHVLLLGRFVQVSLWVTSVYPSLCDVNNLKVVFRSLKGCCHDNQFLLVSIAAYGTRTLPVEQSKYLSAISVEKRRYHGHVTQPKTSLCCLFPRSIEITPRTFVGQSTQGEVTS